MKYRIPMNLAVLLALALLCADDMTARGEAVITGKASNSEADANMGLLRGVVTDIVKKEQDIQILLGSPLARQRYGAIISSEHVPAFPDLEQLRGKTVDINGNVMETENMVLVKLQDSKQLQVINRSQAPPHEQAVIRGLVAEVLRSDKVIRINLGAKQPDHRSSAVIYPDHFAEFPDLDKLVGKAVEISGDSLSFPNIPHVQLANPAQITLLQTKPKGPAAPSEPVQTTGEIDTIRGLVAEVLRSDKVIRVNIGAKSPNERFSAVIYPEHFDAFEDVDRLEGQLIEIKGEVTTVGGKRHIVLVEMKQVSHMELAAKRKK